MLTIVLLFSFFILFYFPIQQERYLLKNYNTQVQNLANTVSLGVKIALTEQNFEGVQTAMDFVKDDKRLVYMLMVQTDTIKNKEGIKLNKTIFKTFPAELKFKPSLATNDSDIVKSSPFNSPFMNGEIVLAFSKDEIAKSKNEIRSTSMLVSSIVLIIGILIGFLLAKDISVPVYALRDAALKVGLGDRSQRVKRIKGDEIGELGNAFNKMVDDLATSEKELNEAYQQLQVKNEIITLEKHRSEELLLNILPEHTAIELKDKGYVEARQYDNVTVMFTDFKDFTIIAEKLTPKQLVSEIDGLFKEFDSIITKHNIEKIKTIGDAYMCVGGLPEENTTHPFDVINAAKEIIEFIEKDKEIKIKHNMPYFDIRIGIHTGSVIAGVVGHKKFAYDIWGDAVNIASRMESSGEAGKINISGSTFTLIQSHFNCTPRGKVHAKNKGDIEMYFVEEPIS